jgi:hypothetical protein
VEENCRSCEGSGAFAEFSEDAIRKLIMAGQGKNKGKLRASMVSPLRKDGVEKNRAYYVWRMARFHGGVDVTMPMMAGFCVMGDPYRDELDALADKVSKENFGSDLRGAMRWGRAFGMI